MSALTFRFYTCLLAVVAFLGVTFSANGAVPPVTIQTDSLTKQKVKKWIQTRIATAKLQNKMKANAEQYDNVIQSFYQEREKLLESKGWTVNEFEALQKRINRATTAMEMAEELEETQGKHEKEIENIRSNEALSEEQKQQMIKSIQKMREQKQTRYIEPTKSDWPAVKPYRSALEKLTDWVAGNIPNPPKVN